MSGPLTKRLSSSVREILEDVIERKRERMVVKINDKIKKSEDKLRLSLSDLVNSPFRRAKKLLGGDKPAEGGASP